MGASFTNTTTIAQYGLEWLLGSGTILNSLLIIMSKVGSAIFDNLPLIFAVGVAIGMAKREKEVSALSAVIAFFVMNVSINAMLVITGQILSDGTISPDIMEGTISSIVGINTLQMGVFGGIIVGLGVSALHNKFYRIELPSALSFFGGTRFIPIISTIVYTIVGIILFFTWPIVQNGIYALGSLVTESGYAGTFAFGIIKRGLIPFGLHHVLSSTVRFTEVGGTYLINGTEYVGILNALNEVLFNLGPSSPYWSELMPKLTGYLAVPQMVTTLFRFPAIGLAMYHTSFPKNKKIASAVILTCVMTAFLGNITEPLEFSFLFIAPQLFAVYLVLSFLFTIPISFLNISIGYIRGTIFDFGIFGLMYENTNWIQLVILGIINFVVFYFAFKYFIKRWNLETPGRESFDLVESSSELLKSRNYPEMARITVEGLGGRANIKHIENCISRLRVDLEDPGLVNQEKIREAGCSGIFFPSEKHIHVVFGPHVEFVKNEVDDLLAS